MDKARDMTDDRKPDNLRDFIQDAERAFQWLICLAIVCYVCAIFIGFLGLAGVVE